MASNTQCIAVYSLYEGTVADVNECANECSQHIVDCHAFTFNTRNKECKLFYFCSDLTEQTDVSYYIDGK